jgi:hypothetical protein
LGQNRIDELRQERHITCAVCEQSSDVERICATTISREKQSGSRFLKHLRDRFVAPLLAMTSRDGFFISLPGVFPPWPTDLTLHASGSLFILLMTPKTLTT